MKYMYMYMYVAEQLSTAEFLTGPFAKKKTPKNHAYLVPGLHSVLLTLESRKLSLYLSIIRLELVKKEHGAMSKCSPSNFKVLTH